MLKLVTSTCKAFKSTKHISRYWRATLDKLTKCKPVGARWLYVCLEYQLRIHSYNGSIPKFTDTYIYINLAIDLGHKQSLDVEEMVKRCKRVSYDENWPALGLLNPTWIKRLQLQ